MASLSTPTQPRLESTQHARATARKIIFIYVAWASGWILIADALRATVFSNSQHLRQLNTFNSWFFVAGTAWLLYRLIRKLQIQTQAILEHEILAVKERMDNAERKAQATQIQSINQLDIQASPFALNDLLDNLATSMSVNARDKNLELVISPAALGLRDVVGDAMRLEQVLINLTGNAIKFTAQGHVALHIRKTADNGDHIRLRFGVSDSGIGIAPDKQKEIFAEFSPADVSTSRPYGGTGLGLTISRRLVESMGGELHVNSELGQGSEFWFELPFPCTPQTVAAWPDTLQIPAIHLVIAEEHAMARDALRTLAEGLGWHTTCLCTNQDTLTYLKANPADNPHEVLLLDFKLPLLQALKTAPAAQQFCALLHSPLVVATSACAHTPWQQHPLAQQADAVITQPITPNALHNAVSHAIQMRRGSATPAHAPNPGRLAGLRMLVVDDHAVNREVVQRIFSREGAQVHTAADGQAAIDWLTRHKPPVDVVLMDIQMPFINGYEATQKIRAIEHLKNLPVIALTAGALVPHQAQAQQAGMTGYMVKPFDVDNAVQLILKLTAHAATPQHSAQPTPQPPDDNADLPGMAITKALTTWLDASPYQNFLRLFADNYQHIAQNLRQLPTPDAQALAHKVRGAAANLGLTDVAAAAQQVERRLDRGEPWDDALLTLQQRMDIALESIRQYTLVTHPATPWAEPLSAAAQRSGLEKLLKAWQSDNAQTVEQALRVPGLLSHDANLQQQTALYSYDFRAGEAYTAALMQSLLQNP